MPERGPLLAIGGHEDRSDERRILRVIARYLGGRPLALVTFGSSEPDRYVEMYRTAFEDLGVEVVPLPRDAAAASGILHTAGGAFLTGGKQGRLVSRLTGTGIAEGIRGLRDAGGIIAGTSAGASALAEVMILSGPGKDSPGADDVKLGPGLGLMSGVVIDQHFAQRGRGGRLRAAVAADPSRVGIGIDEDTAVEIAGTTLTVCGSGAVSIIDARHAEAEPGNGGRPATLRQAVLSVLADGDTFSLAQ